MPQITREDIREALEECIGDFQPTYDPLGMTDPVETGKDLIRYTAGIFLHNPDAKFFLAYLFAQNLLEDVEDLLSDIDEAISDITSLGLKYKEPSKDLLDQAERLLTRAANVIETGHKTPYALNKAAAKLATYSDSMGSQLLGVGTFTNSAKYTVAVLRAFITTLGQRLSAMEEGVATLISLDLDIEDLSIIAVAKSIRGITAKLSELKDSEDLQELFLFLKAAQLVLSSTTSYPEPDSERASGTCSPINSGSSPARRVVPPTIIGTNTLPIANSTGAALLDVCGTTYTITLPTCNTAEVMGTIEGPFELYTNSIASITMGNAENYIFATDSLCSIFIDGFEFDGTIAAGTYSATNLISALLSNLTHPTEGNLGSVCSGWVTSGYGMLYTSSGRHRIIVSDSSQHDNANIVMGLMGGPDTDDSTDARTTIGRDANNSITIRRDSDAPVTATIAAGTWTTTNLAAELVSQGILASNVGNKINLYSNTIGDGGRVQVISGSLMLVLGFYADQIGRSKHIRASSYVGAIARDVNTVSVGTINNEKYFGQAATDTANADRLDFSETTGAAIGDYLIVLDGPNEGAYNITNTIGDTVILDRNLFENDDGGPINQRCRIGKEVLTITPTETIGLDINIDASGDLSTLFGFPASLVWGTVSDITCEGNLRYARVGDLVELSTIHIIEEIKGQILTLDTNVSMDMGTVNFTITSTDKSSYDSLYSAFEDWVMDLSIRDMSLLTASVNRAVSTPSEANKTQLINRLTNLRAEVASVQTDLENFECRSLEPVETVLKTLEEKKLSHGAQELRDLKFSEFFNLDNALSYAQRAYEKLSNLLSQLKPSDIVSSEPDERVIDISGMDGEEGDGEMFDGGIEDEFVS